MFLGCDEQPGGLPSRQVTCDVRNWPSLLHTPLLAWFRQASSPSAQILSDERGRAAKSLRLDLMCQLHSIVTALLPTLAEVGQIRIEFAVPTARGGTFGEGPCGHKAMN